MSSATSVAFLFVINDWRANVLKNIVNPLKRDVPFIHFVFFVKITFRFS